MDRSSDKLIKKFSSQMQARLLLVFCIISLLLMALGGRLIYLTQTDGERYAKQVLSRQSYVSAILPYKRGEILDRNGTVLARSELRYKLILDPKFLLLHDEENITDTINVLEKQFGITKDSVEKILEERPKSQYVILQKNLRYQEVNDFKELIKDKKSKVKGIWFEEEYIRNYPYDTLASDVIGFTSTDNIGYFGIEEYYNEQLNGKNGREYGYYDSSLNIDRIVKKAEHGNSIISTIDINVQRIVQSHIRTFNTDHGSKSIGVIVMNPNNGEILAMASNEEYNLNSPRTLEGIYTEAELEVLTLEQKTEVLNKIWRNDVISSGFEPGSTFKPFTVATALEESLAANSSTYECDGGEHVGGWYIRCNNVRGHGVVTLGESLMKSCNDAMMQIAALEGRTMFYDYINRFGFGTRTGIDLPGEESGIVISLENLKETELATSSFGQTFNVTMIQMAASYASLVNGGFYYEPRVVKQIINDKGATVNKRDKVLVRQTVSKETSNLIQEYMYHTVEEGTAKGAQVNGYMVGGKTGTAQKFPREAKTYVVSFIGAVPAINPEVVIYVVIDEPQNVIRQDDSSLATKLASRILTEILPALGIFPEGDIDYLLPSKDESSDNDSDDNSTNNQSNNQNNNNNTTNDANLPSNDQQNNSDEMSNEEEEDPDPSLDSNENEQDEFNGEAIGPMDE